MLKELDWLSKSIDTRHVYTATMAGREKQLDVLVKTMNRNNNKSPSQTNNRAEDCLNARDVCKTTKTK
jgi:hypothetical protein